LLNHATSHHAQETERLQLLKDKADQKMTKERERELARLEAERRKHMDRMLREQKKEEERRQKEAERLKALQLREEVRCWRLVVVLLLASRRPGSCVLESALVMLPAGGC
jgi:hypothetical protein